MNRCVFGPRVTPTAAIALRGVRLRSRLSGMSQRTTIEQTYVNLERGPIEAVYTIPLPESAAVCGFEVVTGDRVLTGEIDEIEKATETYDDAIADGHGAFLAEQHRPDVFSVRVGNLLPRQAVTVRLTYVCPLERADRAVRVAFPTTVAPRYVTATATDPMDAQVDGDALNPPHVLAVPYGLTMEVEVDLGRPVRRMTSPSHSIRVTGGDETRSTITLSAGVTEMDRDIVLSIELEKEHAPVVQVARGTHGESYLAVTFVPEFDVDELPDPQPSETVFVLDCSGSMQGASLAQATAALELCLRSLSPGDTFNVCRFGSTFDLLATEPLHYSQPALERAIKYVRASRDLGGTELYGALKAVMSPGLPPGRRRQVVVLTDGQVSNEPALLDLARDLRTRNRVFSFGIGSAASSSLVKGLARATGGAAEFITAGERIDDKVLRTFGRLTSPMVEDVSINWDGCDVQTLADLPPVFDGDVMTVFGRAPGKLPRTVTLSCKSPAGPKRWSVPVPPATDDAGVIATMWARRTIQSLEDVNRLTQRRYRRRKERSREEETVIQLSKEFNLLSSLTAFVAVEHRSIDQRNDGTPALRRIPVTLARDWGGVEVAKPRSVVPMPGIVFSMRRAKAARVEDVELDALVDVAGLMDGARACAAMPAAPVDEEAMDVESKTGRPSGHAESLRAILALQQAEGWFGRDPARVDDPAEAALRRSGHDPAARLDAARTLVAPATGPSEDPDRIARTLLVLALLHDHYHAENGLWRRAEYKALRYLQQVLGRDGAEVKALVQAARAQAPQAP
jgi:Ca-activated chloride channel family protein